MIPLNTIRCCDCLDGMREIPDKSIDLVITDPPYGIGKTGILNDDMPREEYIAWMVEVLSEIERVSSDGYFIFHNESMLFKLAHIYKDCRLFASCNNFSIMGRGMPYAWSPIVFKIKNKDSFTGIGRNWFICNTANMENTPKRIGHPSPKPIDNLVYILEMFSSKTILDPFIGSGSTAIACLKTNRDFIGFELNNEYFEKAQIRIKKAQEQGKIGSWF